MTNKHTQIYKIEIFEEILEKKIFEYLSSITCYLRELKRTIEIKGITTAVHKAISIKDYNAFVAVIDKTIDSNDIIIKEIKFQGSYPNFYFNILKEMQSEQVDLIDINLECNKELNQIITSYVRDIKEYKGDNFNDVHDLCIKTFESGVFNYEDYLYSIISRHNINNVKINNAISIIKNIRKEIYSICEQHGNDVLIVLTKLTTKPDHTTYFERDDYDFFEEPDLDFLYLCDDYNNDDDDEFETIDPDSNENKIIFVNPETDDEIVFYIDDDEQLEIDEFIKTGNKTKDELSLKNEETGDKATFYNKKDDS